MLSSSHFQKLALSSSRARVKLVLTIFIVLVVVSVVWIINYRDFIDTTSTNEYVTITTLDQQQQQQSPDSKAKTKPAYIYHINFADRGFKKAQKRNCECALSKGKVDECLMFNMNSLDNEFREKNKDILSRKRGSGYWLWKPYIILHTMLNVAKPDDYIIYVDSGKENKSPFIVPGNGVEKLLNTQNIVIFPMGYPEGHYTKRDAFVLMGMDSDPEIKLSGQMNAASIVVKNTFKARRFIGEWLTYMQDTRASTDDENTFGLPNDPGFKDHRHDQSVLSLLAKKWKLDLHGSRSYWGDFLTGNKYGRN